MTDPKRHDAFYIVILLGIVLAAATLYTASQLFQQDDTVEMCLLHELQEHRVNSYDADRDAAVASGKPFNVPRPAPAVDDKFAKACDTLLSKTN